MPPGLPDRPGGLTLSVGALGQVGCDWLGRATRAGTWQPPEGWTAAPRPVRETVPAIYASPGDAGGVRALLAVPAAGFVAPGAPAGLDAFEARPLWSRDAAPNGCGE